MSTIRQIGEIIEEESSLRTISRAYSEIASAKLTKIRADIETTGQFVQELTGVFRIVKLEAQKRKISPPILKQGTARIVLTSNHNFYGNLERPIIRLFLLEIGKSEALDQPPILTLVIGKTGAVYFKTVSPAQPPPSLIFAHDLPKEDEFQGLVEKVKTYQKILVYHSHFRSLISQVPVVSDVTQSAIKFPEALEITKHIYEPEIGKMLKFFDQQILTLLLKQTFLESELARTASRLIFMNQAQANSEKSIVKNKKLLFSAKKSFNNIRILERSAIVNIFKRRAYGAG